MTTRRQLEEENESLREAIVQKEGQLDAFVQGLVNAAQSTRSQIKADVYKQFKARLSAEYDRRRFAERKLNYEYDNVESAIRLLRQGVALVTNAEPLPISPQSWLEKTDAFIWEMEEGGEEQD